MGKISTMTIRRKYTPAQINSLEAWLRQKALEGWRLIAINRWAFIFESCAPFSGEYFVYKAVDRSKGLYFDYYMAKEKYKKSKSPLNKRYDIAFEVDPCKIDERYPSYKKQRNDYYARHYMGLTLFWLFFSVILFAFAGSEDIAFLFFVIGCIPFFYSLVSFLTLLSDKKYARENTNVPFGDFDKPNL